MLQTRQSSARPLVGFYAEYRGKGSKHTDELHELVALRPVLRQLERDGLVFLEEWPISFENDYR